MNERTYGGFTLQDIDAAMDDISNGADFKEHFNEDQIFAILDDFIRAAKRGW